MKALLFSLFIFQSLFVFSQNESKFFNGTLVYEHFTEYLGDSEEFREGIEMRKADSTVIEIFGDVYFESIIYRGIDTAMMSFQNKKSAYSEFLNGNRINFDTYGTTKMVLKEKTDSVKNILGYQCQQYIYESEAGTSIKECWISNLNGELSKFKNQKFFYQYFTEEGLILEFRQSNFSEKYGETIRTNKLKRIELKPQL